ncbi:AAA family ATPase [Halobacteriovorax sp. JY17]|uniref:AAA family ATPase n=1 Tax=Halobacteriovorax sp. JY17 TaxID=2014617 RepID=UPI000C48B125|nr:AAA family ATPase [Halobacteriovorax sp. JY17]PIK13533.1 MAG: hypothetical protein CES88_16570 [Halobacteriovorax sp. JY17]
MSSLVIKRLRYSGDTYSYESPEMGKGLNVLEAQNGHGKTTFSSLIYFGLGGNPSFFKSSVDEKHIQVISDTNNFVELEVDIDEKKYTFKRLIEKNDVIVTDVEKKEAQVFPIFRNDSSTQTFPLWIASKLSLSVAEMNLGIHTWSVNFLDYLRLLYQDQIGSSNSVYKEAETTNFISDSILMRKAIFELIMGKSFPSLYKIRGEVKKEERELTELKGGLTAFDKTLKTFTVKDNLPNVESLEKQLSEKNEQLSKLEKKRKILQIIPIAKVEEDTKIKAIKNKINLLLNEGFKIGDSIQDFEKELIGLSRTHRNLSLEISQINKILVSHQHLSLFSPDTCPICLERVQRERNKCLCGTPVMEEEYEKFFYNTTEYIEIIKSKEKNKDTLEKALTTCEKDILNEKLKLQVNTEAIEKEKNKLEQELANVELKIDTTRLSEVDDKILSLRSETSNLENQIRIERERDRITKAISRLEISLKSKKATLKGLEASAEKELLTVRMSFNQIYTDLMKRSLADVKVATLNDNYEPVINYGEYREASSKVSKRLLYYLSLYKLSLDDTEIPLPRFLLIDTPKTHGIDSENYSVVLEKVVEVAASKGFGQIILTTGTEDCPEFLKDFAFETMEGGNKLLKENK